MPAAGSVIYLKVPSPSKEGKEIFSIVRVFCWYMVWEVQFDRNLWTTNLCFKYNKQMHFIEIQLNEVMSVVSVKFLVKFGYSIEIILDIRLYRMKIGNITTISLL